jgi:hypothetical protein
MDQERRNEIAVKVAGYLWGQRRRQIYVPSESRFSKSLGADLLRPETANEDIGLMSTILDIPSGELSQYFEELPLPEPFASDIFSRSPRVTLADLK